MDRREEVGRGECNFARDEVISKIENWRISSFFFFSFPGWASFRYLRLFAKFEITSMVGEIDGEESMKMSGEEGGVPGVGR